MDARIWILALNTLLLAGATCAISVPLGTALAWLLTRTDLPGRRIGMLLLGLMLFVPLYLQAAAWQAGFGVQGWFTSVAGLPSWLEERTLLEGWTAAIWVHSMAAVPWVALIVGLGLRLIEPELEEQALLDGTPRQVLFRVTLRGALPAVGLAGLWVAVATAREMTVTDLFQVRTYAEELYTQSAFGPPLEEAPLTVLSGVALTACLVAAGLLLCAKLAPGDRPLSFRRRWIFRFGRWRIPMAILMGALLLLLIGVPLASLCYKMGVVVKLEDNAWQRSWSAGKGLAMLASSPWRHRRQFGWSLSIGALAATGAVVAAIGLAWLARRGRLRAVPALLLTAVCLAVPGPLIGIGIVRLLNRPNCRVLTWFYHQSMLAPWIALFLAGLPLATLIMWHALRTVPAEILDSAAVDGAGSWRKLWAVALPSRTWAIGLAWVVALAAALGELGASILVVPAGVMTLPIQIFDLLHSGVDDRVAGICLALLMFLAAVAGLAAWLAGRWARRAESE